MKPAPGTPGDNAGHDNYAAHRSPVYRALWEPGAAESADLFRIDNDPVPAETQRVMDQCRQVLLAHREQNTLRGPDDRHSPQVLQALASAGYWGLLVEREYGGSGCAMRHFLPFLTRMAVIDAPLAGLAAVHGCIGAVDPLQTFGTAEQKQKLLPALASGERLSAFCSTELDAGSDLRAIRTTAVRTPNGWSLSGQKAFITNLAPGRTIGLLCKVEERLAVVVTNLPDSENEHFQLISNPLHPLKHTLNQGMRLRELPVPSDALLQPPAGKDGRAIIFHGLNRGRAAICALAAGNLRVLLAGMIAWAKQRTVQGKKLAELELIQARCGQVAALIGACDALAQWCGSLLDAGYRGEIECIIAKVFASEAVKTAAFNLALPTHGGRFFLQGHPAGDMAYDYLAPCIYEGENDLLRLALVHALAKSSGERNATDDWQPAREKLLSKTLSQPEMVALSRQIEAIALASVTKSAADSNQHLNQIALGKLVIERDLLGIEDAPPFRDPLA